MHNLTNKPKQKPNFRNKLLQTLRKGIKQNERFEDLCGVLLTDFSTQLLIADDFHFKQKTISDALKQIEEANIVRRFNMMHESPENNKKLKAALHFVDAQFRLKYNRYITN